MTKVGRFVTDPKAGAYCRITLDNGEKLIVHHDKGGFKGGRLRVEVVKLMGFSSRLLFSCDLDVPKGQVVLGRLTHHAAPATTDATPLGAFVNYVKDCASVAEVTTKCAALTSLQ
jgi:hypothetical protein